MLKLVLPKLCDSKEMRSAKRLRIKSLQKAQEYSKCIASIPACPCAGHRCMAGRFVSLFNLIH